MSSSGYLVEKEISRPLFRMGTEADGGWGYLPRRQWQEKEVPAAQSANSNSMLTSHTERFREDVCAFRLGRGPQFMEYDLIYVQGTICSAGARNVDGRGFNTERNRPTNLQIPLRPKG